MEKLFFDNWESIFRTIIITLLTYVSLIFFLRTSGKRTLSQMNAFDMIVTFALGSTLATVMLNKDVALAEGLLALVLLILLQYGISFLSVRYKFINRLVKSEPTLLVHQGKMLKKSMLRERINEDEIMAFLRQKGKSSLQEVVAIVLETDGSLSLVSGKELSDELALRNVKGMNET